MARYLAQLFFAVFILLSVPQTSFAGTNSLTCSEVFSASTTASGFNYFSYYMGKLREVKSVDRSAPFATFLRFLITTRTTKIEKVMVPLRLLKEIHPVDRDAAVEKLNERIEALRKMPNLPNQKSLTAELVNKYIPSKNLIRVIKSDDGDYVVFDGNGRLLALREVFNGSVDVEVELHRSNSYLLQKTLRKVREVRGLLPAGEIEN